jgi:general secretion pathway protein D
MSACPSTIGFITFLTSSILCCPSASIVTSISDDCHLNVIIKDKVAKAKLKESINYIKLNDIPFRKFLDYIFTNNGYFYTLKDDTLTISYIKTKTFKVDYVNNTITGTLNFSASTNDSEGETNTLSSNFSFDFWKEFSSNINAILTSQAKEYYQNPTPIINQASGLVTITGTKEQLEKIGEYINELNKRLHKEVLVDVKIYSVQLSDSHQSGINWSSMQLGTSSSQSVVKSATAIGQTILDSTTFSVSGLLNFLSTYGQVNSVSNPKITTLNNQKAIITVGETRNYSYKSVTTDANGNAIQSDTIDSKFIGILLDITPEISDDNVIIMNINPSVSSLSAVQLNTNLPPNTIEKKLNTIVRIKDGSTIILGGLITSDDTFQASGVPVLKEIPLVKYLFSYKEKISNKRELIFVITPHIVDLDKKVKVEDAGYTLPKLEEL